MFQVQPSHIKVARCAGSCQSSPGLTCYPLESKMVGLEITWIPQKNLEQKISVVFSEICWGYDSQLKLFFRWQILSEKHENICSRCLAHPMLQTAGEKGRRSHFVEIWYGVERKFKKAPVQGEGRHLLLLWLSHLCSKLFRSRSDFPPQSMQVG